jgi:hypothetical protein
MHLYKPGLPHPQPVSNPRTFKYGIVNIRKQLKHWGGDIEQMEIYYEAQDCGVRNRSNGHV